MARTERPIEGSGLLEDFARDLRAARARAGLTYRQMAAVTGLSIVTLSSAANGRNIPTWSVTAAYLRACRCAPNEVNEWERRWHSLRPTRASVEPTRLPEGELRQSCLVNCAGRSVRPTGPT